MNRRVIFFVPVGPVVVAALAVLFAVFVIIDSLVATDFHAKPTAPTQARLHHG